MKITLEKCGTHVCVKDKDGKEMSKWGNEGLDEFGGFDKILARLKKEFPKAEITVTQENPAPSPSPTPAPSPEPAPAPGN